MSIVKEKNRFAQLIETLEAGWEIDPPVLLGAMWHSATDGKGTYHFVLRHKRDGRITLVSLPPSSQLLIFLAENNITVSRL